MPELKNSEEPTVDSWLDERTRLRLQDGPTAAIPPVLAIAAAVSYLAYQVYTTDRYEPEAPAPTIEHHAK